MNLLLKPSIDVVSINIIKFQINKLLKILIFIYFPLFFIIGCNAEEDDWNKTKSLNTLRGYRKFIEEHPYSSHIDEAYDLKDKYIENANETPISKAQIQIDKFSKAFGDSVQFTQEQVRTYIERLENETYSMVIDKPLEYYEIEGDECKGTKMTKKKVVIEPSRDQKACSLQLEAGNLSLTAIYISTPSINRALFLKKWDYTFTHNGCAGPGLEIEPPGKGFQNFLITYSISYREFKNETAYGIFWEYVMPDLLWGSDDVSSPNPHKGAEFIINNENPEIVFKVEGVKGMPNEDITTYMQALALKTYLKIRNNE